PRFALTVAGVYTLLLRGVCGSDSCQCMVRFVSNGCPKLCPCDSTFPKSINPNFIVKSKKNCGWSFQAAAMSECDSVTFWIKPESGNQPAIALGPTLGTGIVLSGSLSGFYYIWMTVTRTDSDGLRCSISTRWKRQFFGCLMAGLVCDNNGILNGGFSEGATAGILGQGGMSAGWQRVAGEPEVVPDLSCGNPVSMRLRGNCLGRDIITGKTPMTIQADSNYQFHFCYKSTSPAPLPGTALVVTLTDSLQTTPDCAGNCVEFGRFDLTAIDSDWYEADGILTAPSGLSSAYLNLQVENDLALDDPDSRSAVLIDNLCLDKDLFIVSIKEPVETNGFRIFPNPNTGTFQLAFSQAVKPGAFFRIIGISGQALQTGQLDAGLRQQEIDTRNLPGGLYFLEIVSATGVHEIRKFVKQ
ncbi:MAG: T9SS type A sorting domain-containing protein, partial [Saprospiraceae bacterium]